MATTFPIHSAPGALTGRDRKVATCRHLALWTLQGWVAMFFFAAGYAKLTEPMDSLIVLMGWPAFASQTVVHAVGVLEVVLALGVLAPLLSWRLGRPATAGLIGLEAVMAAVHGLRAEMGLTLVNGLLLAITIPVLLGRRTSLTRSGDPDAVQAHQPRRIPTSRSPACVWKARQVFVSKRGQGTGYWGIENPLFYRDNTRMFYGLAKKSVDDLIPLVA